MVKALLSGDFAAAFFYNAFLFVTAIPMFVALCFCKQGRSRLLIGYGIALILWSIIRNFGRM